MQIRAIPGSSVQLMGEITDLDSRSHEVQVEFPHERVDSFKTTFGTRAFEDSFKEILPVMCWQHDLRDPIGRGIRAQVLPRHNEVVGRFSDINAVPSAARAFSQIDDGTLTDFSFGYVNGPEYPHPDPQLRRRGIRQIPRATMREISPVTIGSIPGAKVAGIREDGNLVTADSPETVARLVELKVITPEVGNELLRGFGFFSGVREDNGAPGPGMIGAGSGVPWSTAEAVAHLQEAHGVDAYKAGLGQMTPQTLAILHSQVGGGFHDHGNFQGWLAAIAGEVARAIGIGGSSLLPQTLTFGQDAAKAAAMGAGYSAAGGRVGGPGDFSLAVPPLAAQVAAGSGYHTARGATTDCQMHAQMAKDAAAEAVSASGAGDRVNADHKARHARMHARQARMSARPDDMGDMGAAAEAESAAQRASDAADSTEPSGAGGWNEGAQVRAEDVMAVITRANPAMALQLRDAKVALAPANMDILFRAEDGSVTDGTGTPVEGTFSSAPEVAELAANVDAALDSARQWLDGVDLATLPDEAQQALALVSAAADGSSALLEAVGGVRGDMDGDGDDFSDSDWDFDESDYTPEQYRAAALIDKGTGDPDSKERYALPIKEPSGKINRRGIEAAAGRLNQVEGAPTSEVHKAAKTLAGLYGKMRKPVPPHVLKLAGAGERADAEAVAEAEKQLERLLNKR